MWGLEPNVGWKAGYEGLLLSETGQTLCGEIRLDVFMNLTSAGQSFCKTPIEVKQGWENLAGLCFYVYVYRPGFTHFVNILKGWLNSKSVDFTVLYGSSVHYTDRLSRWYGLIPFIQAFRKQKRRVDERGQRRAPGADRERLILYNHSIRPRRAEKQLRRRNMSDLDVAELQVKRSPCYGLTPNLSSVSIKYIKCHTFNMKNISFQHFHNFHGFVWIY